jgi:hypothetical protein
LTRSDEWDSTLHSGGKTHVVQNVYTFSSLQDVDFIIKFRLRNIPFLSLSLILIMKNVCIYWLFALSSFLSAHSATGVCRRQKTRHRVHCRQKEIYWLLKDNFFFVKEKNEKRQELFRKHNLENCMPSI